MADESSDKGAAATTPSFEFKDVPASAVAKAQQYFSNEEIEACNAVPREENEVWQVAVKRLRCFVPGQTKDLQGTPVRPFVVLVASLHPAGRLLAKHPCNPPEVSPSTPVILAQIVRSILEPGADGVPPGTAPPHAQRPGKVTFSDPDVAAACARSLTAIGVETAILKEAPQFNAIVHGLTQFFCARGMAKNSPACEQPGMTSVKGVTDDMVKAFFKLTAEYTRRNPWARVPERNLIRIRADPVPEEEGGGSSAVAGAEPPTVAWVGVVGNKALQEQRMYLQRNMRPPPPMRGLCVFFKRYDAEYRLLCTHGQPVGPDSEGDDGMLARKQRPPPPPAVGNPLDMVCARPECGKTPDVNGSELQRCGRCKEVYYCGRDCQSIDWSRHAPACKKATVPDPGPAGHWGEKELVLILENPLMMPIADHEVMESAAHTPPDFLAHPVPLSFSRDGRPSRPSRSDLIWLMRGMAAVLKMTEERPGDLMSVLPMTSEADLDLTRHTNEEHWYDVMGDACQLLHVRTDPILTRDEHGRLQELIKKDKEEMAARRAAAAGEAGKSGPGASGSSEEEADGAAAGPSASSSAASSSASPEPPSVQQPSPEDEMAFLSAENLAAAADKARERIEASDGGGDKEGGCVVQ